MKGVVFNILGEMVEEQFGIAAWDALLQQTELDGEFVATESYADEDLFALVGAASEATGFDANDLVFAFGRYMVPYFFENYPEFFKPEYSLREFLLTVDSVIHVEVRKLMPEANLPSFDYGDDDLRELTMTYRSPRKLCRLAEGLIQGAADHYKTSFELDHSVCMHDGGDHCTLKLRLAA
ncbi:MAG: heme NO-binding domain-containing protein [Pseudomonadota bacterium]